MSVTGCAGTVRSEHDRSALVRERPEKRVVVVNDDRARLSVVDVVGQRQAEGLAAGAGCVKSWGDHVAILSRQFDQDVGLEHVGGALTVRDLRPPGRSRAWRRRSPAADPGSRAASGAGRARCPRPRRRSPARRRASGPTFDDRKLRERVHHLRQPRGHRRRSAAGLVLRAEIDGGGAAADVEAQPSGVRGHQGADAAPARYDGRQAVRRSRPHPPRPSSARFCTS